MSQWLRWDLNRGPPGYKPFSLTTGPHSLLYSSLIHCWFYYGLIRHTSACYLYTVANQTVKPGMGETAMQQESYFHPCLSSDSLMYVET